jgi:BirA family transcriptional regulator, biotin operon repressor / biotin---[acetyl-CoA-carboxylase] ligase
MFDLRPFETLHFEEIDSTNTEAIRRIGAGQIDRPTVISASMQSAGRGSRGRSWSSATGNLHATFVLPLAADVRFLPLAVYPLALAVARTIEAMTPLAGRITIKWPNDILVDGRKLSGSLHEVSTFEGRPFLAAGVGVNVLWAPDNLPDAAYTPVALAQLIETPPSASALIATLGSEILEQLESWQSRGFADIMVQYHRQAHHLNEEIALRLGGADEEPRRGIYRGIDGSGALLLDSGGAISRYYSTDVFPSLSIPSR